MRTSKIRFIIKLTALFLSIAIISVVSSIFVDVSLNHGFLYAYEDKLETLKNTQGEKTVFVGGSSVLFGVSAEEYERLSGKPSVNMGLNAGAYDVYLASIIPYIHKGDTIVLGLEFEAYADKWYKFDEIYLDVAHSSKGYYKNLPLKKMPEYFYKQTLRNYNKVFNIFYNVVQAKLDDNGQLYIRKNIMENGDINKTLTEGNKKIKPFDVKFDINHDSLEKIMEYIKRLENAGANVYIAYPPCYANKDDNEYEKFDKEMKSFFEKRVLGERDDWTCSEADYFYDTAYHLNREGAVKHTEYIYNLIEEQN